MSSLKKKADIFHRGFNPSTCKTSLKLAASRLKLLRNKRDAQVKVLKREVAQLLEAGQEDSARVKVEHVIREEKAMSAYEMIELYCEIIAARLQIIESQKQCPLDLKEAVSSVIFAQARCADLPELKDVRQNLTRKYGKDFAAAAAELRPESGVSSLIVEKLSAKAPSIEVKIKVLTAIAAENDIDWKPKLPEQQLQTPTRDEGFLSEPSTFQPATKLTTESAKPEYVPQAVQKQESEPNTRPQEPSTRGDSSSVPEQKQKETEAVYVQSEEQRTTSHQQYWSANFKDAAAAAEAAAKSAEMANLAAKAAADIAMREKGPRGNVPRPQGSVSDEFNQPPSEVSLKSQHPEPINRQPVRTDRRTEIIYEETSASEGPGVVRDGRRKAPEKEYYDNNRTSGIKPIRNSSTLKDSDELDVMPRNTDGTFHKKSSFDRVTAECYQVNEKMARNDDEDVECDRTDTRYQYPRSEDKQARMSPRSKPVEETMNCVQIRDDRKRSTRHEYLSEDYQGPGSAKGTLREEVANNFEPFQDEGSFRSSAASQFGTNSRTGRSGSQRATSSVSDTNIVDHKKSSFDRANVEHYQENEKMARDDGDDDIDYDRTETHYQYSRNEDHVEQRSRRGKPVEETKNYRQSKDDKKQGTHFVYFSEDWQGPGSTEGTPYEELEGNLEPTRSEDSFRSRAASRPSTGVFNGRSSSQRSTSSVPSPDIVDDDARRGARIQESFDTAASLNSEQAAVRRSLKEEQIDMHDDDEVSYSRTPIKATSSSFKSAFDESGPSFQDPTYDWHGANTWKEHVASEESVDDVLSGYDSIRSRKNAYNDDWYQSNERQDSKHAFSTEEVVAQSYMKYEDADIRREDVKGKGSTFYSVMGAIPFEDEVASARSDGDPNEFISGSRADGGVRTGDRQGSSSHLPAPAFDDGDSDDGHRIDFDNIPSDDDYEPSINQSGIFLPPASPALHEQPESKYMAKDISSDTHEKDIASAVFDNYEDSDHDSRRGDIERSPERYPLKGRSWSSTISAKSSSSRVTDGELQLHEKEDTPSDMLSGDSSSRGLENPSPLGRKRWDIPTPRKLSTRQYTHDETIVQERVEEVTAERMKGSDTEDPESGTGLSLQPFNGGFRNRPLTFPYLTGSSGKKALQSEETSDSFRGTENADARAKRNTVLKSEVSSRAGPGENVPDSHDLSDNGISPQHRERGNGGVSHPPKHLLEARKVEQVGYETSETQTTVGRRLQVDGSEEYQTNTLSRRSRKPAINPDHSTMVVEDISATALYESSKSERSSVDESFPSSRNSGVRRRPDSSYDPKNSEEVGPQPRRSSAVGSRRTKPPSTEPSRGEFRRKEYSDQGTLPRDKSGYGVRSTISTSDDDEEVDHQSEHHAASGGARGSRRTSVPSKVSAREELPLTENYDQNYGRSMYFAETEGDGEVDNRRWSRTSKNELPDRELSDRTSLPRENYDRGSRSSLLPNDSGIDMVMGSQSRHSAAREGEKLTFGRPRVSTEEFLRRESSGQEFAGRRRVMEKSERGYGRSVPSPDPESDEEINTPPQPSAKLSSRRTRVTADDHSWKETAEEERYQHPHSVVGRGGEREASRRTTTGLTWESKTRAQEKDLDNDDDLDARTTKPQPNSRSSPLAEKRSAFIPESRVSGHEMEVDVKLTETKATENPSTPPTRDLKQKEPSSAPSADADLTRSGSSGDKDTSNENKAPARKLPPDYDSFVANFQRLRANARK